MMETLLVSYMFMATAIVLEVIANIFMKLSKGWKKILPGIFGILCIMMSFTFLSQAIKNIDISIAYAMWGGLGIIFTSIAGSLFFKQPLSKNTCIGILFIISGILLLKVF